MSPSPEERGRLESAGALTSTSVGGQVFLSKVKIGVASPQPCQRLPPCPLMHYRMSASCLLPPSPSPQLDPSGDCPYITVVLKCPHPQNPPQLLTGNGLGERLSKADQVSRFPDNCVHSSKWCEHSASRKIKNRFVFFSYRDSLTNVSDMVPMPILGPSLLFCGKPACWIRGSNSEDKVNCLFSFMHLQEGPP